MRKRFNILVSVIFAVIATLCGCGTVAFGTCSLETDVIALRSVYLGGQSIALYMFGNVKAYYPRDFDGYYGPVFKTDYTEEEFIEVMQKNNAEVIYIDEYKFFRFDTLPGLYWWAEWRDVKGSNYVRLTDMYWDQFVPFPGFLFEGGQSEPLSNKDVYYNHYYYEGYPYKLRKSEEVLWEIIDAMGVFEVERDGNTAELTLHLGNRVWDGKNKEGLSYRDSGFVYDLPFTITIENGTAVFGYPYETTDFR